MVCQSKLSIQDILIVEMFTRWTSAHKLKWSNF